MVVAWVVGFGWVVVVLVVGGGGVVEEVEVEVEVGGEGQPGGEAPGS